MAAEGSEDVDVPMTISRAPQDSSSSSPQRIYFDGSNWEDLPRLVSLCYFEFLQSGKYEDNEPAKCARLSSYFTGAALDYASAQYGTTTDVFSDFEEFVARTKAHFAATEDNLITLKRSALETLSWTDPCSVFFAEFDRLTSSLGINSDVSKVALLKPKLPAYVRQAMASWGVDYTSYHMLRNKIVLVSLAHQTLPRSVARPKQASATKPKCGKCGKKGHTGANCRSKN
ncbi:hypothetical protein [Paenibacillus thiaminolyticus]|uniref:hypothetical protein n=1 Tax=Paenibacillus thiaminolyticus TaxID=49283 RepID=UPI002281F253|nr:hypothetical protein [Paenibacillus thiaminolyticus]MCY9656362.1 hypothetical protein [Paenibacillus thiaminolyticus]